MKITLTLVMMFVGGGVFAVDEPKKLEDPLVGKWEGMLNLGEDHQHRVTIEIKRKNDRFSGTLTIPEQVERLAFEEIVFEDDGAIRLVFPLNLGSFSGKVAKDDFKGTWRQGGAGVAMTLKRVTVAEKLRLYDSLQPRG